MAKIFVLDSFALLAHLQGEPAAKRVRAILLEAEAGWAQLLMSMINWGETLYITEREKGFSVAQTTAAHLDEIPLTVVSVDRKLTLTAAHIKANFPVSYADSFAVALAQQESATLLTGDPEFKKVSHLVAIEWLPQL